VGQLSERKRTIAAKWSEPQGTFDREFDEPQMPDGWKKLVEAAGEPAS
jgi:hypothetical protein